MRPWRPCWAVPEGRRDEREIWDNSEVWDTTEVLNIIEIRDTTEIWNTTEVLDPTERVQERCWRVVEVEVDKTGHNESWPPVGHTSYQRGRKGRHEEP